MVHAADTAFSQDSRSIDVSSAIEQAVARFEKLFPGEYQRLEGVALRNKVTLTTEDVRFWNSPSQYYDEIAGHLDEMFDKEVAHAQDTWRPPPHESTQK